MTPDLRKGTHHVIRLFSRRPITYVYRAPALFALHLITALRADPVAGIVTGAVMGRSRTETTITPKRDCLWVVGDIGLGIIVQRGVV